MLLIIGAVISVALCAPMQQSSDASPVGRKKQSENLIANAVALIQALAKLQDMAKHQNFDFTDNQEEEDDDTLHGGCCRKPT